MLEAPLNRLTMLTDYVDPEERNVACPNQDVVYGLGMITLDVSPVVVQVPDFGDRFWVYQIVDLRTDSFVQLGKMYGTGLVFTCLSGRTGTVRYRRELPVYSVRRAIPALLRRGSSRTTRRKTSALFRAR